MTTKRKVADRLQVGLGLISFSVVIAGVGIAVAIAVTDIAAVRIVILVLFAVLIAVLWRGAVVNDRAERAARDRLRGEHPGALVERVRLWSLPKGRVHRDIPVHFLVADAQEITFETIDQTVLVRIPVEELGFVDIVTAQGDRALDRALTLIYGDDQLSVQFFTITYASTDRLRTRLRTAIGWPADGTPATGTR